MPIAKPYAQNGSSRLQPGEPYAAPHECCSSAALGSAATTQYPGPNLQFDLSATSAIRMHKGVSCSHSITQRTDPPRRQAWRYPHAHTPLQPTALNLYGPHRSRSHTCINEPRDPVRACERQRARIRATRSNQLSRKHNAANRPQRKVQRSTPQLACRFAHQNHTRPTIVRKYPL